MVLVLGTVLFTGCHKDTDDDPAFVAGDATYELTLENNTNTEIEIFLQGLSSEDFERRGLLAPGEEMKIELTVEFTYVVRANYPGSGLEDYFFQESITRSSPTDFFLEIND